ncbi:pollen-specific leucine-rich repeat extensin-like protein 2 isoform X1 [Quillaja saponaria]|uniref:Pollen-specific leucine-rich repeat extensin-like protein 2 isoform X1 n=1 Tax=Quillaja saponaria TaxID=32244 RepID=A0AAD7P8V8_QUISA|nr:pollen-specific leucine-rich repeat extensin-like protein 2 isoform X1 [Quillaja saponaria]
MAEKVTIMKLNVVDLQCHKCYTKVKKVLCKFPQIRDQTYDEKKNVVMVGDRLQSGCVASHVMKVVKVGHVFKVMVGDHPHCQRSFLNRHLDALPPAYPVPIGVCCESCSEGREGGPCFQGYGRSPPCYEGHYGRPVYDSYGGTRPCHVSRCDYLSEENPSGCTIM